MLTGRKWTDKELAKMERRLHKIYKQASEELTKKAEDYFKQFEEMDKQKRLAVQEGRLSEDEYLRWRRTKIFTGKHWTRMKEQAAQDLYTVNQRALEYINGRIPNIYAMNYNFSAEDIQNGVSNRISFEMVDAQTVKNLSFEDKSLLPPKKHWDPKKDIPWNMKKINSECLQGILQGENMSDIAKRLLRVGVQNEVSAIRAARTIVNAAENKGRFDSAERAQENGVILGKRWITVHDSRTRDWHKKAGDDYGAEQDAIPLDEPFIVGGEEMMYPGEVGAKPANVYNCRCGMSRVIWGFVPTLPEGTIKVKFK